MDNLIIEGKINASAVNFACNSGLLKLTGRSIPANPVTYDQPIETWVTSYLETQPAKVTLFIHLDYLNTNSISNQKE